jgi:molecular chaperone HscB
MHGIDVTAEDGATHHALDPETLMEVMEVQETIEEVGAEPGAESTIAELKKQNEERVVECLQKLANAFNTGDVESARKECVRLRFWYNIAQGLKEWEPGTTEIRLVH